MFKRRLFLRSSLALAGMVSLSTAITGCSARPGKTRLSDVSFDHGVASGDPLADGVMLWTRAAPDNLLQDVNLAWELAEDRDFSQVLRSGDVSTGDSRDYTVKVDVRDLEPGREYFYRFYGASSVSPVGRAKTLPVGPVEQLRLAVFSCANYPAGYFHAYREASRLENLDACLHLGDYLYEHGDGEYATELAAELGREFAADNNSELLSLTDYRKRYALYRRDTDLQAIHAAAPMIAVWDDHEVADDSWSAGARNHSTDEGDYALRLDAAVQAYFEWMPLRPIVPDAGGRIYRSFDFGDLLSLHMLDTRVIGRDQQLEFADFASGDTGTLDVEALTSVLDSFERSLLGPQQWNWLAQRLQQSPGRWQMLGQQVLMTRMSVPEDVRRGLFVDHDYDAVAALVEELTHLKSASSGRGTLSTEARRQLGSVVPYNLDAWDGYPLERDRLYAMAKKYERELVVLSADTHNSWHSRLRDRDGSPAGIELSVPSVSSPGMETYLGFGEADREPLQRALEVLIDELEYCQLKNRGYIELNLSRDTLTSTWHFVNDVTTRDYQMGLHRESFYATALASSDEER